MENNDEIKSSFQKLFQDGKLVQVHIGQWGMSQQLIKEDLGLGVDDEVPDFISLGRKYLIDADTRMAFNRLESKARSYLVQNSFNFPSIRAHFVTRKRLGKVIKELTDYKKVYDKLTEEFIANYDQLKQKMLDDNKDHKDRLEPFYPPIEEVKRKFKFRISMFEVSFPKNMKEVSIEEMQAQNELVEEMKKSQEEQIRSFVNDSVIALRSEVVRVFEVIAERINSRKVVSESNIKSIKEIVGYFEDLDFFNDNFVREKLDKVKQLVVDEKHDFRDNRKAVARLKEVVDGVLESTQKIADVDAVTGEYCRRIDITL